MDEESTAQMIIKGSILTNQTNSIGACHLTRYSSKQPLEPEAVKIFTLRGLPNGFDVDTQYTLKSEVNNPFTKEISFIGLTKSIATYNIVKGILKVKNQGKVKVELKTPQAYGILTNATLRSWPTKSKDTHGVTLKLTPVSC